MSGERQQKPESGQATGRGGRCPVCGQPRVHRFRPFCSAACRDRDLLRWLEGRYALPAVEAPVEHQPPEDRNS